jgi:CRP/FNR family cyclic AMP-dependent transcriptional regulator
MELVSRMMDGSISYELTNRLEPILSGSGVQREAKIDLTEVPLFEGCSERQLRSIARIARVVDAPAGSVITRVGEPGNEFYLILAGTVSVDLPVGKPVALRPGAFFGEMSLLDGDPRSATVVTETPVRLLVINRENFSVLRRDVPDLTQILLVTLSRRVRQVEQRADRTGAASAAL